MDRSHSGNLKWTNGHSLDDMQSVELPSPAWHPMRPVQSMLAGPSLVVTTSVPMAISTSSSSSSSSSSSTMSFAHTGQLSPISNGMDNMSATDSSASLASPSLSPPLTNMTHSGPSSLSSSACTTSSQWSLDSYVPNSVQQYHNGGAQQQISHDHHGHSHNHGHDHDHDDGCEEDNNDFVWDEDQDEVLAIPKQEPDDDDFCMDDLKEAPATPIGAAQALELGLDHQSKQKRPRGRPRKHPLMPNVGPNKVSKGRSKTGCLTCRKRKKKCDEAKPRCMNCEKNAVVCEGYPEKQIWKSGKERAEEERLKSHNIPSITLQPLFHGLETVEDMIYWKHYNEHLSTVLTVEGEHKNAFKDMMVPIAVKHQGLMHSILSLASKHMDFETPYGMKILTNNPSTSLEALHKRSIYHHEQSREKFYADVANTDDKLLISARYGQMLCFLLESLAEGNPNGDHRYHLAAYRRLISISPPQDPAFLSFISEFFQYHIFADELFSLDSTIKPSTSVSPIHPPRLIGVADGLLTHLTSITSIRNMIRSNMAQHIDPLIDYESLYRATEIDSFIRDWMPNFPPGDSRELVALLYKQMMWIYLFRTIYPPQPSSSSPSAAPSIASSCSTVHSSASNFLTSLAKPLSTATPPHSPSPSPPPIRAPPTALDPRVTTALEESLNILESFKPSDPSQTLLLLPCLVIGTACFVPEQQERIRQAIRCVRGYTGLRNGDLVLKVLEEVWRLMGEGDWEAVWDWAGVAREVGIRVVPA